MFGRKKCQACKRKIGKGEETAELRLNSTEGVFTMEICNVCAHVLDSGADIQRRKPDGKE